MVWNRLRGPSGAGTAPSRHPAHTLRPAPATRPAQAVARPCESGQRIPPECHVAMRSTRFFRTVRRQSAVLPACSLLALAAQAPDDRSPRRAVTEAQSRHSHAMDRAVLILPRSTPLVAPAPPRHGPPHAPRHRRHRSWRGRRPGRHVRRHDAPGAGAVAVVGGARERRCDGRGRLDRRAGPPGGPGRRGHVGEGPRHRPPRGGRPQRRDHGVRAPFC